MNKRRRKILDWLAPNDFEAIHERNFRKRFQNTGQWLLDDSRFTSWRDEEQSGLLWCHGARRSQLQLSNTPLMIKGVVDLCMVNLQLVQEKLF